MKTALKAILYLIGFPLLLAFLVIESLPMFKAGETYSFYPYIGIMVAGLFAIFYLITALVTWSVSRKTDSLKKLRRATAALVAVGFIFTSGIWIVMDQFAPPLLSDATDGTILYPDVQDDYLNKAELHGALLKGFINMNYENGNLSSKTLEEYQEEGWQNEEVKELIAVNHTSLREDGFDTFVGPWGILAVSERLTFDGILHLIINERPAADLKFIYKGEGRGEEHGEDPINWTIMDMVEGVMTFDISSALEGEVAGMEVTALLTILKNAIPKIVSALNEVIADESVAGSYIYIDLDLESGLVTITPTSPSRGVWDYMQNAWFESNHIILAVLSLFFMRHLFLIFGGVIVVASLLIGLIREKQFAKNFKQEESASPPPDDDDDEVGANRESPYLKSFYSSMEEVRSRRGYFEN
ncbi:MAG: hypothetical protein WC292_06770 [Clostridia bacterium]